MHFKKKKKNTFPSITKNNYPEQINDDLKEKKILKLSKWVLELGWK